MVLHPQMARGGKLPLSISSEIFAREDFSEESYCDIQSVMQLLDLSQELYAQVNNQVSYLCEEVERITQSRAHLHFDKNQTRGYSSAFSRSTLLPIQLGDVTYGILCVHTDQYCHPLPALTRQVARLLAQICGFLLHLFEQSVFLRVQYEHLDYNITGPLTRREREVLGLMYRGYTEEEIAKELNISSTTVNKHRQNIYGQLGVHNEYDARLVAYHTRMFPIIEKHEL